ncbi:LOW QUALITY PROTEIN: leydig cell tumor 10 kDa protein homolog [Myxocyprinus asiaticus]|uniref:LOW QUALITY PROTEIN: leydig cell tumor 10 kDa protein homolog n=1 Tax=Myxocyprinus asiaticus TaxID=70543 RepID=UPI0022219D76|nr:LOW QUALITY PROTEIN: leydig cell tumor 10 kDa protein homolog [Myxocyprinus asiaticus]
MFGVMNCIFCAVRDDFYFTFHPKESQGLLFYFSHHSASGCYYTIAMAQGKQKCKEQRPGGAKNKQNNPKGLKKGGRIIAPKKAQVVQQQKLKKGLEVAIRNKIEQEVTQKASTSLHKKLSVLNTPVRKSGKSGPPKPAAGSSK